MNWLKQSTAVTIKMGPFLAITDGDTEKTALTIAQADIRVSKAGGSFAQTHNVAGAAHDEHGQYGVPLDTTDTDTLGRLRVSIHVATALAVWQDFIVLSANVYDALVGASVGLKVDLDTIKTQAVTCAGAVAVLASLGTAVTSTAQTGDVFAIAKSGGTGDNAAIKTQTDKLVFTLAGKIDANTLAVGGTTQTARDLGLALPAVAPGASGGLPTTNGTKLNQTADLTAGQKIAATLATADVTGNLPAQVKGQDNIDFGALQKASLNAATPASVAGAVGSVTAPVTAGTVTDKTGYALIAAYDLAKTPSQAGDAMALVPAEHANLATDAQAGLTAQGYTTARAPKLDNLDEAVSTPVTLATSQPNYAPAKVSDLPAAPDNTSIAAIKLKTDNLPPSPAATGAKMDLIDAPNAAAVADLQAGMATAAGQSVLANLIGVVQGDTDDIQTRLPAVLIGGRIDATVGAYQTGMTPAKVADLPIPPTTDAIVLAILERKITHDSLTGEFVIWSADGTTEVQRLIPTTDAAALPIVGMEPA